MKKNHLLFLIIGISFSINCNSQVTYDEGYYINNLNQKIDCLIKNEDWDNNPTEFNYKISEQTKIKTLSIDSIKEFGINNVSKYIRFIVNIDRSSNSLSLMSNDKNPIFKKEQLFLKVLIEGKASLFIYKDQNLRRYFYKTNHHNIDQLIFKKYKTEENKIGENNDFRGQLYDHLKCKDISINDLKHIEYKQKALIKLFSKYNSCNNSEFVNFEEKVKSDFFNLNFRFGLNNSSLAINNDYTPLQSTDYGSKIGLRVGMEFEFIMKFNKNKWAVIVEPTYQYFKAEDKKNTNQSNTNADYKSIEIPLGLRHYVFLNKKSKIFINGSFIYDLALNSKVRGLDVKSGPNLGIGMGYNYNNTYSIEFRYQTKRNLLTEYALWTSNYQTASIIFGYTLF